MSSQSARTTRGDSRQFATLGTLLIIVFLGLGLRLYQLDADSLWLDELKTVNTSRVDLLAVPRRAARTSVHPPLLYVVTNVFFLLGNADFVVRLPAALLGSASILLTYKLGEILWTRREGLAGAFLLAVNPYHVEYSQEARHYALMVFLALLSLILLMKALETGRKTLWLGFALSTSLALYSHYFAFLILPAEVVLAAWVIGKDWWSSRTRATRPHGGDSLLAEASPAAGRTGLVRAADAPESSPFTTPNAGRQALTLVATLALIAVSYLPWLPAMWTQITLPNMGFQGFDADHAQITSLSPQFFHDLLSNYSGLGGVPLLLFVALFILGLTSSRRQTAGLILLWISTPFLFLAFVHAEHWFNPRYVICILPLLLLAVARGLSTASEALSGLVHRTMASNRVQTAIMTPLLIVVGLLSATSLDNYYHQQKEKWREVAQHLATSIETGDAILADGIMYRGGQDDDRVLECLPYYLDDYVTKRGATLSPIVGVKPGLWNALQSVSGWSGSLWAVLWYPSELSESDNAHSARFGDLAVVTLGHPSGRPLFDTESILRVLLDVMPAGDAHFDIHLALANLCIRAGQLKCADSELDLAAASVPNDPVASPALSTERSRFERLAGRLGSMTYPLWHSLNDQVALLGHDLDPGTLRPGETLRLTIWWRQVEDMETDYTAFIHIVDDDDLIWAQQDEPAGGDNHTTSTWAAAEIVSERYQLSLPGDIPSGDYTAMAGLYDRETGQWLPVWNAQGVRLPGDMIMLQRVTVAGTND